MKRIQNSLALPVLALASLALNAQTPPPATTPAGPAASAAPASTMPGTTTPAGAPVPTIVDDIIKLWKANLSEEFLKKYVSTSDIIKQLTAEDIVRLRNAGLPENLILAITQRKMEMAGTATPAAAGAGGAAAASLPIPTPVPTPPTTARWEGLARRNSGVVLLKSRWDPGILEVKDGTLRWVDSKDVAKNLNIPLKSLNEQQLTCLKKSGGNECFEWVAKTKGDEFRFRNIAWEQNENARIEEIFAFMKALDPNLVSSQVPVNQK